MTITDAGVERWARVAYAAQVSDWSANDGLPRIEWWQLPERERAEYRAIACAVAEAVLADVGAENAALQGALEQIVAVKHSEIISDGDEYRSWLTCESCAHKDSLAEAALQARPNPAGADYEAERGDCEHIRQRVRRAREWGCDDPRCVGDTIAEKALNAARELLQAHPTPAGEEGRDG